MPASVSSSPDRSADDAQWRCAGERMQALLDACSAGGAAARDRAEQLVREVSDLYGAALDRMLTIAGQDLAERFAADDLVASLLLVHGLHPHRIERRVADALDRVRPYLGSHGGDVHLLDIAGDVVRLRFSGTCQSCPSSAITLELAVQDAVLAAAPEIRTIEVVAADEDPSSGVIPAEALLARLRRSTAWQPVPELAELFPGEVGGFRVAGTAMLACRVGEQIFAYHDRCPGCTGSMAGARLRGRQLRCPRCGAGFDVVHAGAGVDAPGHLEPIPVLVRDGVLSAAVAEQEVPT